MRLKYYRKVMALTLILLLMLQGCTSKNTKKNDGKYLKLEKNIIVGFDRKGVKYYNFDDLNEVLYTEENAIDVLYNNEPLVVVNIKQEESGNNYIDIYTKDNIITLKDFKNYSNIKLSDNGRYLGYYGYNDEEVIDGLKIFDIETREEKEIPSEYIISGDNYSITNNKVYFYGVHNQGNKAGLYQYDIEKDQVKERDINVDGIVVYYKVIGDSEIILTFDGMDYKLDIYKDNKRVISRNDFTKIEDFLYINNKYYIVGVAQDDTTRIYEIISSDEKRTMTFEFPKNIYASRGIAYDDDNIYFIGGDNSFDDNKLYKLNIESREVTIYNAYSDEVKVK
ncbi:Hypothetical protein CM240_1584 [Clostridium bornimense]|uniref:Lipoprotein n=1 Tax=Clostridium bornimense TaxID=1216932 RepID=W6S358_9CLOT|nr:hypothetical protein [Clostridium bornimense]CDM68742.1 Hypothetical protein CM240_1584 [Clostridium bornimense]